MTARKPRARDLLEYNLPDDAADMIDADSARAALREKLGIDADVESTIHVYLIEGDPKIDNKIWQGDAEAYNLESLAKTFGSGLYRVKAYARNAEGYKPLVFNFTQAWKLSPDDEAKVIARREAAKNPPAQHNGHEQGEMMRAMLAGFEQIAARMAPPPAQVDPFTMFEKIATAMRAMQPATPAAAGPDLGAMLGMLKTLKEITGDAGDGMSATERLLMKAADAVMPVIAAGAAKQTEQAQAQAQPAAQLPAPAAGPKLTEEQEHMEMMQRLKIAAFQLQLKMANKAAARGVVPEDYAETIYDAFDEDDIEGLALAPDWWEIICKAEPGSAPHKAFFDRVRATIISMAVEDGILAQDAAGNLTAAGVESTKEAPQPNKAPENGAPRNKQGAAS